MKEIIENNLVASALLALLALAIFYSLVMRFLCPKDRLGYKEKNIDSATFVKKNLERKHRND